jgi:hypothetical protein
VTSAAMVGPTGCESVVDWATTESVVILKKDDSVVARALSSGRSRVLREADAKWVLLDPPLDLLWIQGATTLDVLDLRAPSCLPTHVVSGLPENVAIEIDRDTGTERTQLKVPDVCSRDAYLFLDWSSSPAVRFVGGDEVKSKEVVSRASLIGKSWLTRELHRVPGKASFTRKDLTTAPAGPVFVRKAACSVPDLCGRALPFGSSGQLLILTGHSEADCQHYACKLFDPASKTFASPPSPKRFAGFDAIEPGPCGLYRFDRVGEHYLFGETLCSVGGSCEPMGGEAIGWLDGGAAVGTEQ